MNKYPHLTSPIRIGNRVYPHRIVASPIYCGTFCMVPGMDRTLRDGMISRAKGGCAQITVGETPVDSIHANREDFPGIDFSQTSGKGFDALSEIVREVHKNNTAAFIELSHCGSSTAGLKNAGTPIGPMDEINEAGVRVTPMDEKLMEETISYFVRAAKWSKAAGFDGVLLHCGHGWLIHQFLSPRTNKRTDEYGGSLENRARFPLNLIKAIRKAMGPDFLIEIRVSGEEMISGGMTVEETAEFCRMADPYINLAHISVGTYRNPVLSGEFSSMYQPHGLNAEAAKYVKERINSPVVLVGGINSPEQAEMLIADGYCDLIALGRELTADPDFANKVLRGKDDDIQRCVRCFKCFPGQLEQVSVNKKRVRGCTVNPYQAFTDDSVLNRIPSESKNVLIIGGGAAGLTAANEAAKRGHKVTLCEKSDRLGGLLHFTDTDVCKKDLHNFMELLINRAVNNKNINILLNKEVTAENIHEFGADHVILALGSHPSVPPISGIENAVHAIDAYNCMEQLGDNIVMLGGGLVGCEVGLHLAKCGKKVTIIEMMDKIAGEGYQTANEALFNELKKENVICHTGIKCTEIKKDGVIGQTADGSVKEFPCTGVVFALGMRSNDTSVLTEACKCPVDIIGDCLRPARVFEAGREGMVAAACI